MSTERCVRLRDLAVVAAEIRNLLRVRSLMDYCLVRSAIN